MILIIKKTSLIFIISICALTGLFAQNNTLLTIAENSPGNFTISGDLNHLRLIDVQDKFEFSDSYEVSIVMHTKESSSPKCYKKLKPQMIFFGYYEIIVPYSEHLEAIDVKIKPKKAKEIMSNLPFTCEREDCLTTISEAIDMKLGQTQYLIDLNIEDDVLLNITLKEKVKN